MSVRTAQGFTIFELMITVTIAAVVTAFAIPAFQDLMARSRVNGAAEEIANAMVTARNMAVSQRRPLMLGMTGSSWSISQATTGGDLIDLQRGSLDGPVVPTWPAEELTFDAGGRVSQTVPPAAATNWAVSVCDNGSRRERGRNVTVSRVGRIQTTTHATATTCNP